MKKFPLLSLLLILALFCGFSGLSVSFCEAAPPKVPGNQPTSHARHPPGTRQPPRVSAPVGPTPHRGPAPGRPAPPPGPSHHHPGPPHHHPGPYLPPGPPRVPVYLYPPLTLPAPAVVPYDYGTGYDYGSSGYGSDYGYDSESLSDDAKLLGTFKAFVYEEVSEDPNARKTRQTGVSQIYLTDQNLISGYFFTKVGVPPNQIQGSVAPQTGDVTFRVVGMKGTYRTTLQDLTSRDEVELEIEKTNEETGEVEFCPIGCLSRVEL